MRKYVLSPQAQMSLRNIRNYTTEHFGKAQAKIYLTELRNRMRHLASHPLDGKKRDDIKVGYYSYFQGSHTIYYRIGDTHIDIIDVLHQRMEPESHL